MSNTFAVSTPELASTGPDRATASRLVAVVNFRTEPNGSYRYVSRGLRRGYWRVLLVRDPAGSRHWNSHNVREILWRGPSGIDGVTPRSAYYLGASEERAHEIADAYNAGLDPEAL